MSSNSSSEQERRERAPLSVQIGRWFEKEARRRWADYGFIAAFIVLIIIAASISKVFFTPQNVSNIFRQVVTNGLDRKSVV